VTTPPPPPPAITTVSVAIDPATAPGGIPANIDFQLKATETLSNGISQDVTSTATWLSSDDTIVSVSTTGQVRGLQGGGPVDITETSGGVASAPLVVTVNSAPDYRLTEFQIAPFSQAVLPVGETRTHTAFATFSDGTDTQHIPVAEQSTWHSDNEAVVTVEKSVATGQGKGNTEIWATIGSPPVQSNKLPIYVDFATPQASLKVVPVQQPGDELLQDFTYEANAIFKDETGAEVEVSERSDTNWSSGDESVLTVSNEPGSKGFVTAIGPGKATVTATYGILTGRQEYTVSDFNLSDVQVLVPANLPVGLTAEVRVTADDPDTPGKTIDITNYVILKVFDPAIATASNSGPNKGTVTGVTVGSTRVEATLAGLTAALGSRLVKFDDGTLNSIAVLPPGSARLPVGVTQKFKASGTFTLPAGTTSFEVTRQVTFKSSDATIAEISNAPGNKGEVHGLAVGMTDITAEYDRVKSNPVQQEVVAATLASLAIIPANSTIALKAATRQLKAEGNYSNGDVRDRTDTVTWISSDKTAAEFRPRTFVAGRLILRRTTTPDLLIQAVASGEPNGITSTLLTINDPAITGVSVAASGTTIKEGETKPLLTATGTFSDGQAPDVTIAADWKTSVENDNVKVVKGVITGVSEGTSTVIVEFGGFSDNVVITVTAP
jgi:hypothetical protein